MFDRIDLGVLEGLLARSSAVVAMQEIHAGNTTPTVIGLRHDVDDNHHSFETACAIARWEAARGYRSTYFVLHTASYWTDEPFFRANLEQIAIQGHEIGIHANAIAAALASGGHPDDILWAAIDELRGWGFGVRGVVAHGDELCRISRFVNDEMFSECARADYGAPDRVLQYEGRKLRLEPRPMGDFGLVYDSNHLARGSYLSDSGGVWSQPLEGFTPTGQLHVLWHPDWWSEAFLGATAEAAA